MGKFTAIIRNMYGVEKEEVFNIPDLLNPEETIRTNIRMFNLQHHARSEFVRLKKTRRNGTN